MFWFAFYGCVSGCGGVQALKGTYIHSNPRHCTYDSVTPWLCPGFFDELQYEYVHVDVDAELAGGGCECQLRLLGDGQRRTNSTTSTRAELCEEAGCVWVDESYYSCHDRTYGVFAAWLFTVLFFVLAFLKWCLDPEGDRYCRGRDRRTYP